MSSWITSQRDLFAYALGRSLAAVRHADTGNHQDEAGANDYTFGSLIESIVTSPQFLNKRGGETR